jgi:enoyl-CoA hydratase/carnithine racemase/3-hydroxyacyl-CoA dehydrogenase
MSNSMRKATLETIGLGSVLEIFQNGELPADAAGTVDAVFGPAGERGALVISGAQGIVGSGKAMQLGSRLQPYGVPVVALDFPGVPNGIAKHYGGLARAFGRDDANAIMQNIVQLNYDGKSLPAELNHLRPRFLLEAIPEILDVKRTHYEIFRSAFPDIEIRSVTSGFPSAELGVGIAHPAFPHEINKVWEIVEEEPSAITRMLWALGLIPVAVSDDWSFVLDVLFCGVTHAALRYHEASNMPEWKVDKFARKLVGPNPFRAHDAIGAAGANFLTWSCLHHLGEHYGALFTPTATLTEHKDTGADWYPPNHFRPLVDWSLDDAGEAELDTWLYGPLFQMVSLMIHEQRADLATLNAIGELCAQFRRGIVAVLRERGADAAIATVEAYHRLHPESAGNAWYPGTLETMGDAAWQQLYVNAEHDGSVGVLTLSRESYNRDVDAELNRALDWLGAEGVGSIIISGDFHLSTQLVGADTNEFFAALDSRDEGIRISSEWTRTARRLNDEFRTSVALINGKRCMGGMLELMLHCHFVLAVDDAALAFPEVTLPVVPGMEGCHWPFRRARREDWGRLFDMLLTGRSVRAEDAVGWLIDYAGPLPDAIRTAWAVASGKEHALTRRELNTEGLLEPPLPSGELPPAGSADTEAARKAIASCVEHAARLPLAEALAVQAEHSAGFMVSPPCHKGAVGQAFRKTMAV